MDKNRKGRRVVISASASNQVAIIKWRKYWTSLGYRVINDPGQEISKEDFSKTWPGVHKYFYRTISKTDILFIANADKNNIPGYIGAGVFAEISFATGLNFIRKKKIQILLSKMPSSKSIFHEDIERWLDLGWLKKLEIKR